MEDIQSGEYERMSAANYTALKNQVAASSIEVEEVDNEFGGQTLRVPHATFTTWSAHLRNQAEKRRARRKAARSSQARNRR